MPEPLFSTTGLHCMASWLHDIISPCTGILSPSPPTVSSPPHLACRQLCLTWNHLACQYRGSFRQNPRPSCFDHTLTHTWCAHSLAWLSHRGSELAATCQCTTRSRHGHIKPWRSLALDMQGNRGRKKRRTRSRTCSHSRTRTKHRGTECQKRGNMPPRACPERARHGRHMAMARSFLPNQASREEGEELDHFALERDALCATRRGKRATEGAARDRHVDMYMTWCTPWSAIPNHVELVMKRATLVHAPGAPWTKRGRRQVNSVHHGSSLRFIVPHSHVHREPHPVDVSLIQNPRGDVAAAVLATWRAQPGLVRPSPGPTEPSRSPINVDR
jgi:hypothetical protein